MPKDPDWLSLVFKNNPNGLRVLKLARSLAPRRKLHDAGDKARAGTHDTPVGAKAEAGECVAPEICVISEINVKTMRLP